MKLKIQRLVERLENRNLLSASCGNLAVATEKLDADLSSLMSPMAMTAADNSFGSAYNLGTIDGNLRASSSIGGFDGADYYELTVIGDGEIRLNTNLRGFGSRLRLFDQNQRLLESDVTYGGSQLRFAHEVSAGVYYVSVSTLDLRSLRYELNVGLELDPAAPTAPRDGAGNSLTAAADLGVFEGSRTFQDYVGPNDTADVYRFSVARAAQFDVAMNGLRADADVYLLDSNGRTLTRSDNAGASAESIRGRLTAGEYFVLVAPYGANASNYRLTVSATLDAPSPGDSNPGAPGNGVIAPGPTNPVPTNPVPTNPGTTTPDTWEPLPNVGYFGGTNEWNLNAINAPESWAAGFTGQNVVVAVVDTGIDIDHIELDSNIWRNDDEIAGDGIDNDRNGYIDDVVGWNFINGNNNPNDKNGHGTHVAGTIAAERNGQGSTGVAYDAEIMPVKVLSDSGSGSDYSVASGIRYAVDNGANVINLSLGASGNSSVIRTALDYAFNNNVFVVAASGNESSANPAYPAIHSRDLDNVLSVGAFDSRGNSASFSNKVGTSRATQVEAPGVNIYSTLPDNRVGGLSGTSMAAPHVAGIAALALSARPDLTVVDLKSLLAEGADLNVNGTDAIGAVNAANSVARAQFGSTLQASSTATSQSTGSGIRYRVAVGPIVGRDSYYSTIGFDNLFSVINADPNDLTKAEGSKTWTHSPTRTIVELPFNSRISAARQPEVSPQRQAVDSVDEFFHQFANENSDGLTEAFVA